MSPEMRLTVPNSASHKSRIGAQLLTPVKRTKKHLYAYGLHHEEQAGNCRDVLDGFIFDQNGGKQSTSVAKANGLNGAH